MIEQKPGEFASHVSVLDADPGAVVVTLFRDAGGTPRGSYALPPEISRDLKRVTTGGEQDLLAPIAILRALQAAHDRGLPMSVVDPQRLWMFGSR